MGRERLRAKICVRRAWKMANALVEDDLEVTATNKPNTGDSDDEAELGPSISRRFRLF